MIMDCKNGLVLAACLLAGCSDDGAGKSQNDGGTAGGSVGEGDDDDGGATSADDDSAGSGGASADGTSGPGTTGPGDATGGDGGLDVSCEVDRDCQVLNDCCTCSAANVEAEHECNSPPCFAPLCGSAALSAVCELGTCTLKWACDPLQVTCDALPPECPEGQLPSVHEGGCWGDCVAPEQCDVVPDCSFCGADEACVVTESQVAPSYTCEPMPDECQGVPSCACLPDVCDAGFETCVDGRMGVTCTCPAC